MATEIHIDDSGDLDLDGAGWVTGAEGVAVAVGVELRTLRGYYAADLRAGLDGDVVFGSLAYLEQGTPEIRRVAAAVPGVVSVEVDYLDGSRDQSYVARVNLGDSVIPVEVTLG